MPSISMIALIGGQTDDCSFNPAEYANQTDIKKCAEHSVYTTFLFAVYMLMTHILLLNLLIAMFK